MSATILMGLPCLTASYVHVPFALLTRQWFRVGGEVDSGIASSILISCRIHAVSVSDSSDYFYNHIDNTLQQLGLLKDNGTPLKATDILEVVDGYKGRGYGLSTVEELSECSSRCPTHLACTLDLSTGLCHHWCRTIG